VAWFVFAAATLCYGIAKNEIRVKMLAVFVAIGGAFTFVGLRRSMNPTQAQTLGLNEAGDHKTIAD